MEIVKSRYGLDRVIEKLNPETLRVIGESTFVRTSTNKQGDMTMFDFEGGPCLTLGGKIDYGNMSWKINEIIRSDEDYRGLTVCKVKVEPIISK